LLPKWTRQERFPLPRVYRIDGSNMELRDERYHSLADGRPPDRYYPALHVCVRLNP
jgi:hypothetical protein